MKGKSVFAVYLDSIGFGMSNGKLRLDKRGSIVYNNLSIPTAPLLKSMRNSVGFCFLRGGVI